MTTRLRAFSYRLALACLSIVLLGIMTDVMADAGGRAGRSGAAAGRDCTGCHAAGAAVPTVTVNGPASVAAGTANSYTVTITGGPALGAGVDIAASTGTLIVTDATTKLLRNEIVHSAPVPMPAASVTFTFDWQAPTAGTTATINVAGLSTNGANDDLADGTATSSLSIAIGSGGAQPPTPPAVQPPVPPAALTAVITAPQTGTEGVPVTFDASGSGPTPGSSITAYDWDFGDGNIGSGVSVSNTYVAGSYTVTLTVSDATGASISATQAITIDPAPAGGGGGGGGGVTPGQALYDTNCIECHGPAGTGGDAVAIVGTTEEAVVTAIETVPDMAALTTLSDDDIEEIVAYLQPAAAAATIVQTRTSVNSRGLHHIDRRVVNVGGAPNAQTKQQTRVERGAVDTVVLLAACAFGLFHFRRIRRTT